MNKYILSQITTTKQKKKEESLSMIKLENIHF